jgi:hypothetical protein
MNLKRYGRKRSRPNRGIFPGTCQEGMRKTTKNLRIAGVPAEIQTEELKNTTIEPSHDIHERRN